MTEGMLMMGCPVANGMLSTLLAVFYLVGTTKFVLIAFFRMMVLVSTPSSVLVVKESIGPASVCSLPPPFFLKLMVQQKKCNTNPILEY